MLERTTPAETRRGALRQMHGGTLAAGAGAALAQAGRPLVAPAEAAAGTRSGLAWRSGASINNYADFTVYRGRALDTITCWCPHSNWTELTSLKGGFSTARNSGARVSCAIALLPKSHDGRANPDYWKLAANGSYDTNYRTYARKLAAAGLTKVICRIGWESNGRSRPYFCGVDGPAFIATWRRIATILREADPTIRTEWCNIKKGGQPGSIMNYYPGDDYVDIFGVNYYDGWPPLSTQAIWDSQYYADYKGGPWGIGAWAAEARRRGKKIACSEWGINAGRYDCADNPLYIENMHRFFGANADILAYENYFNQKGFHQLTPNDLNPRSSARYKQLWGAAAAT